MAYRTYVGTTGKDHIQILGNNEYYIPFLKELKRQGVVIDDDDCFGIEKSSGKITEIQPVIDILEEYIKDKYKEIKKIYKKNIFNLKAEPPEQDKDFTSRMIQLQENAYIFVTANLVNYLKDNLEQKYDIKKRKIVYKIKEGKEVWFSAY